MISAAMPRVHTAHRFSEKRRTGDVLTDEQLDFGSLLLSSDVLRGLNNAGFEKPSPIQLKAIPLGRCGFDLIAQAKSGTGKTCVFSVIALENVLLESTSTQVLVLAPTREIAVQIRDVMSAIGSHMAGLGVHAFIGGIPVNEDKKLLKKCQIAVGSPGRIKSLIENKLLKTDAIRLFILDEADKLLDESFQEQINWIFSSLPANKQVLALSATYPEYLAQHLKKYMRDPTFVRLSAANPALQGIKQFYSMVPFHPLPHKTFQGKVNVLLKLLTRLNFQQCLIFSNYQMRAQSLCDTLQRKGWPTSYIAGSQSQSQRLEAMAKLKQFQCRVLISTDLTARGIDAEHVNLVVNMDVPYDTETLLHRIGRAGRFGTRGIAVTFVAQGDEEKRFRAIEQESGVIVDRLPDHIPESLYTDELLLNSSEKSCTDGNQDRVEVEILHQEDTLGSENQGCVTKWEITEQDRSTESSLVNESASESVSNYTREEPVINIQDEVAENVNEKSDFVSTESNFSVSFRATQSSELLCTGGETTEQNDGKRECPGSEANAPKPTVTENLPIHSCDQEVDIKAEEEILESCDEDSSCLEEEFLPPSEQFDKNFEEYLTRSFAQQLVLESNSGYCENPKEGESTGQVWQSQLLGNPGVSSSTHKCHEADGDAHCSTPEESAITYSAERSNLHQSFSPSSCLHKDVEPHSALYENEQQSCEQPEEDGGCQTNVTPTYQTHHHEANGLEGGNFTDSHTVHNFSSWNYPTHMQPYHPYNVPFNLHSPLRQQCNHINQAYVSSFETFPPSGPNVDGIQQSQGSDWENSWRNAYFRQCSYVRAFLEMRFPRPYQYGYTI